MSPITMRPVDTDIVFIAEHRDGKINRLEALGISALVHLSLGIFDRPMSIAVLLPDLGRSLLPALWDIALLDSGLLLVNVALLGCRHHSRIDDLATHR